MKNILNIKRDKNLNYILPLKKDVSCDIPHFKVVIVVCLFYIEDIEFYLNYVNNIPNDIDIILITSNLDLKVILKKYILDNRRNIKLIVKENRGRDISALLVAAKDYILKYDYFCFLHDKKAKDKKSIKDVQLWVNTMWENMIGSEQYIYNIIRTFNENKNLGLLVSPISFGEYADAFYCNSWYNDFYLTQELANKMKLKCDLNPEKEPITLGTIFWAKVPALKKLLEMGWSYTDFDEEPLKNDGTISHAIERILGYVAQDANFETGWVMTDKYAGECLEHLQENIKKAFKVLDKELGIHFVAELNQFERKKEELKSFCIQYEKVYIYGAGTYGKRYLSLLKHIQQGITAFIVSNRDNNPNIIEDIPVYLLEDIYLDNKSGIILAVTERYQDEIKNSLEKKGISSQNIYFYS